MLIISGSRHSSLSRFPLQGGKSTDLFSYTWERKLGKAIFLGDLLVILFTWSWWWLFFSLSGRFGSYRYRQGNGFVLVVLLLPCLFCGKIMNHNNYIFYLLDSLAWIIRRTKDEFLGSCAQLQSCHLLQVSEITRITCAWNFVRGLISRIFNFARREHSLATLHFRVSNIQHFLVKTTISEFKPTANWGQLVGTYMIYSNLVCCR